MNDLISREATIADLHTADIPDEWMAWIEYFVNVQPSVEPERKTGEWIVYEDCEGKTRTCTCNLCGYKTGKYTWVNPNYCGNCGAKMEVDG